MNKGLDQADVEVGMAVQFMVEMGVGGGIDSTPRSGSLLPP